MERKKINMKYKSRSHISPGSAGTRKSEWPEIVMALSHLAFRCQRRKAKVCESWAKVAKVGCQSQLRGESDGKSLSGSKSGGESQLGSESRGESVMVRKLGQKHGA